MQVIRLSGYIADEKVAIARRYLEPQTRESSGVPEGSVIVTDDAMRELITEYARSVSNPSKHYKVTLYYCGCISGIIRDGDLISARA